MWSDNVSLSSGEALARNQGLLTDTEQTRLRAAHVLVAGVGGVGGRTAETLTRLGVGSLTLADPDVFTATNLNRQAGANAHTLGKYKVDVLADICRSIGVGTTVHSCSDGVTPDNVEKLLHGVDLVVDGTDYTRPDIGLRLARAARARGVPVLLGVEVGFGAWQTTLPPDGPTFERLLGLPADVTPEQLGAGQIQIPLWRWVLRIPPYARLGVLREVESGNLEAPAVACAVELSAALLSSTAVTVLTGSAPVAVAPRVHHMDVRTGSARIIRPSKWRFYLSALRAAANRPHCRDGPQAPT